MQAGYEKSRFSTNILLYLGKDMRAIFTITADSNSNSVYQMVPFSVTFSDLFQGHDISNVK